MWDLHVVWDPDTCAGISVLERRRDVFSALNCRCSGDGEEGPERWPPVSLSGPSFSRGRTLEKGRVGVFWDTG